MDLWFHVLLQIWKNVANIRFKMGPPRLLRYYIGGVIEIYYNITWGGVFPIYYNITMGVGGVSRDPKFVLRNIWTAPKKCWPNIYGYPAVKQRFMLDFVVAHGTLLKNEELNRSKHFGISYTNPCVSFVRKCCSLHFPPRNPCNRGWKKPANGRIN